MDTGLDKDGRNVKSRGWGGVGGILGVLLKKTKMHAFVCWLCGLA